jgi:hypothetical protein
MSKRWNEGETKENIARRKKQILPALPGKQ